MFPKTIDRCFIIILFIGLQASLFWELFQGLNNKRLQLLFPSSTENINLFLDIVSIF